MIILIDAYNFLHANYFYAKKITEEQRLTFIRQLGIYGKRKGHKVVLVFDGGPFEWSQKEKMNSVYVVYSGIHETADDYIKGYLEKNRTKEILLVSSDAELNKCADRFSLVSIDSAVFYGLFKEAIKKVDQPQAAQNDLVKMADGVSSDIDALMINATTTVPVKLQDFVVDERRCKGTQNKKVSKNDRSMLKKLYKL